MKIVTFKYRVLNIIYSGGVRLKKIMVLVLLSMMALASCQQNPSVSEEIFIIEPQRVDCMGLVPQKCLVVNGEYLYGSIQDFSFEEGYLYEVKVKKRENQDPPQDASKYSYELIEILSKTPEVTIPAPTEEEPPAKLPKPKISNIPPNCEYWFDGCNKCSVEEGRLQICTKQYCSPEQMEQPRCLRFKDN